MHAVRWFDEARDALDAIWDRASKSDRARISEACENLIYLLCKDPEGNSESRDDDLRVAHQSPLGVRFHIDGEKGIVWITEVFRYDKRRGK